MVSSYTLTKFIFIIKENSMRWSIIIICFSLLSCLNSGDASSMPNYKNIELATSSSSSKHAYLDIDGKEARSPVSEEITPLLDNNQGETAFEITSHDLIRLSGSWWVDPEHTFESMMNVSWGHVRYAFMNGIIMDFFLEPPVIYPELYPGPISLEIVRKLGDDEYLLKMKNHDAIELEFKVNFICDNDFWLEGNGVDGGELFFHSGPSEIWYKIDGYQWTDEDRRTKPTKEYRVTTSEP